MAVTLKYECDMCGKRAQNKVPRVPNLALLAKEARRANWTERNPSESVRNMETPENEHPQLFCSEKCKLDYDLIEKLALAAARAAFWAEVRKAQLNARSAVDALATIDLDCATALGNTEYDLNLPF